MGLVSIGLFAEVLLINKVALVSRGVIEIWFKRVVSDNSSMELIKDKLTGLK